MQSAPSSIAEIVSRELAGERVLWSAIPERWPYAIRVGGGRKVFVPLFLLVVMAIVTICTPLLWPGNSGTAQSGLFGSSGLIFLPIIALLSLAPILSAWEAGRTYYVVTDKRAAIFRLNWRLHRHFYPADDFPGYERESKNGGEGSIVFQRWVGPRIKGEADVKEVGFLAIADTAGAERALKRMLEGQSKA